MSVFEGQVSQIMCGTIQSFKNKILEQVYLFECIYFLLVRESGIRQLDKRVGFLECFHTHTDVYTVPKKKKIVAN